MDRSRLYKNNRRDVDELRRRRVDQSIELRKAKKDEQLQKRRNVDLSDVEETTPLKEKQTESNEQVNYDKLVELLSASDTNERYEALQQCRKTLSRAKNPPIDEFVSRGAVKILVGCLSSSNEKIVFESAWALTNIASGDTKHTKNVVDAGAVPKLISLLQNENISIAEQSVWALGNIAGDGASYRDYLIKKGVIEPVIRLLERTWNTPSVVSNIAWMLSNLCRNKDPPPSRNAITVILPVLTKLLNYSGNDDVLADTAWAISYASDSVNDFINDILDCGCIEPLLKLLGSGSPNLIPPALRGIGNLVIGNDEQTQRVLDAGLLNHVPELLSNEKSNITKETCWMISNIAAGNQLQIQSIIDHNLVPMIFDIMKKAEFRVQKEACWVVTNMITGGSPEQVAYLLNQDVLSSLSNLLVVSDVKVIGMVLDALKKVFQIAEDFNQLNACCLALETCGGLDKLEQLQDHNNESIYQSSYEFIAKYFNEGNDDEENPSTAADKQNVSNGEFNFNDEPNAAPDAAGGEFNF